MLKEVIVSLITSVIGGLGVALVNLWFTRRKSAAETEKLLAEAEKLRAEAEKTRVETAKLNSSMLQLQTTLTEVRNRVIGRIELEGKKSIVMEERETEL